MADDAPEFHFNLVDGNGSIHPIGKPVSDRDQAFAVAKRLAIDIAETRQVAVSSLWWTIRDRKFIAKALIVPKRVAEGLSV
jgi:hypothetical protein